MAEGVKKYTGEDFDAVTTVEEARAIADRLNVEYTNNDGIGKILNACFEDYVEENLIQPTIVYGHPKEISPLPKQVVKIHWLQNVLKRLSMAVNWQMASPS